MRSWTLLPVLCALAGFLAWNHIRVEETFYYWDTAIYQAKAVDLHQAWERSPAAAWHYLQRSLSEDYNAIFALPLLPVQAVWGSSREVFVVALAVIYLGPCVWLWGVLLARLWNWSPGLRTIYCGLLLLLPLMWGPLLRGYPDLGANLMIGLALLALCGSRDGPSWKGHLVAGLVMGLLPLYRRQYAYDFLAFYFALALHTNGQVILGLWTGGPSSVPTSQAGRHSPWPSRLSVLLRDLGWANARLLAGVLVAGGVLWVLGSGFVTRAYTLTLSNLYASWDQPLGFRLGLYRELLGLGVPLLTVLGLGLGLRQVRIRSPGAMVLGFGLLNALVWVFVVRQADHHFVSHFLPLVACALGALAAAWSGLRKPWKGVAGALFGGFWVVHFAFSLPDTVGWRGAPPSPAGFPRPYPAEVRADYHEMVRLARFLDESFRHRHVALAGVSGDFNQTALEAAALTYRERSDPGVYHLHSPLVDSRDPISVADLARAEVVVVPDRFLGNEDTQTVALLFRLFSGPHPPPGFALLDPVFEMRGGIQIRLFQRVDPTPVETLLQEARSLHRRIKLKYPTQNDWVALDGGVSMLQDDRSLVFYSHLLPEDFPQAAMIAYCGPVDGARTLRWQFEFTQAGNVGGRIRVREWDHERRVLWSGYLPLAPSPPDHPIPLQHQVQSPEAVAVTLEFQGLDGADVTNGLVLARFPAPNP